MIFRNGPESQNGKHWAGQTTNGPESGVGSTNDPPQLGEWCNPGAPPSVAFCLPIPPSAQTCVPWAPKGPSALGALQDLEQSRVRRNLPASMAEFNVGFPDSHSFKTLKPAISPS